MTTYPTLHMIIDGEAVAAGARATGAVFDPATGDVIGQVPLATADDLDRALNAAKRGFAIWSDATAATRANVLEGAARLLIERQEALAITLTREQGKPIAQARAEIGASVALFRFYAGECQRVYGRQLVRHGGARSTVEHVPVGPVAAFAPWNFPIFNIARKLGAPVAAGCSAIVKPAEETPASAIGVVQCLLDAGLPPEVVSLVFGVPDMVSRHLIASPIIRKVSFTGSTAVGKHLAALCTADMKRTTMELGGHGPVLVFADCDVETALDTLVTAKYRNAGQVCVSPTRFIVDDSLFERFRDGFAARAAKVVVGSGLDPASQMGPMANARRPDAIEAMIADAVARGAKLNTGGARIGNQGYFYAPTVISDVPLDAQIMNEEPFGPVAMINRYGDEAAMIEEANRLPYGLAAYAWTSDAKRQRRVAREVEAGMIGINTSTVGGADTPFGGVRWSGHGAEDGPEGLHVCLVTKAVHEG